ncbi:hypothetical protein FLA_0992 [Filimonas lacunae]|nr:hypothetical protein FLA_0992 [Filimonas lacunae]
MCLVLLLGNASSVPLHKMERMYSGLLTCLFICIVGCSGIICLAAGKFL